MTPPRRRSAPETRAAILAAARARFGAEGYERATLRAIAADVGVDPAMVIRYFASKEALFAAAADLDLQMPDLTAASPAAAVALLLQRFFAVWEEDATFLALLRASATSETAAAVMRGVFVAQVAPSVAPVVPDRAHERAGLLGSLVIGVAVTRYVLRNPVIADMPPTQLTAWLSPVLQHVLFAPAPELSRTPAEVSSTMTPHRDGG